MLPAAAAVAELAAGSLVGLGSAVFTERVSAACVMVCGTIFVDPSFDAGFKGPLGSFFGSEADIVESEFGVVTVVGVAGISSPDNSGGCVESLEFMFDTAESEAAAGNMIRG